MRLSIQKKVSIFIVFFSALSAAIIIFVIWPAIQRIIELRDQTYQLRLYLEKKYERSARLHNSLETIQQLKKTTANYGDYQFKKGDELKLITALENIAEKNKVQQNVDSSSFDVEGGKQASLSVTITGNYDDCVRYLADLENRVPYFLNVDSINLSPSNNRQNSVAGSGDQVSLHLEMKIYVQ